MSNTYSSNPRTGFHARFLMAIFLLVATFITTQAQVVYVTVGGAGSMNGSSWSNAMDTTAFRSNLTGASAGTEFWLAAGTYTPGTSRTNLFSITQTVSLYGGFAGNETSISQRNISANPTIFSGDIGVQGDTSDNSYSIFNINTSAVSNCRFDGIEIRNCNANRLGTDAAFTMNAGTTGSTLTMSRCIFAENYSNSATSIRSITIYGNNKLTLTIDSCNFEKNTYFVEKPNLSYTAAGLCIIQCGGTISNTSIRENTLKPKGSITITSTTVLVGGGLSTSNCKLTFSNCSINKNGISGTIYSNSGIAKQTLGGGYFSSADTNIFNNCSIDSNFIQIQELHPSGGTTGAVSIYGGGICAQTGKATFNGCTINNNLLKLDSSQATSSSVYGGAFYEYNQAIVLDHSVVANNSIIKTVTSSGGYQGGAIYNYNGYLTISNSVIANNKLTNPFGALMGEGGAVATDFNKASYFVNSTFYNNLANFGGQIKLWVPSDSTYVNNIILWDTNSYTSSKPIDGSSPKMSFKNNNIIATGTYPLTTWGTDRGGNVSGTPQFASKNNAAGNDGLWRTSDDGLGLLACTSSANNGDTSKVSHVLDNTDIVGNSRYFGSNLDMGAYEFQSSPVDPDTLKVTVNTTNTSVCSGATVVFTATPANAPGTVTYQWKRNGSNVGSDSNTYTTNTLSNGTTIVCVITTQNDSCLYNTTASSSTTTMTVSNYVTPSVSIAGSVNCSGNGTFTANPTNGGSTPSYQFFYNGSSVQNGSSATYSSSVTNGDSLRVVMTSSLVCVNNSTSQVSMFPTPPTAISFLTQPSDLKLSVGIMGEYKVKASTYCTYQWQDSTSGHSWQNISGQTGESYTTAAATIGMDYNRYRCVVTDSCGNTATTTGAWLNVGRYRFTTPEILKDIHTSGSSMSSITGVKFIRVNGKILFAANEGSNGTELWVTDGTASGTSLLKDINPGTGSSTIANFTLMNGVVYFNANDGSAGSELWRSDGTAAGTYLVKDIRSGVGSSSPSNYTVIGTTLYFSANDDASGSELWKTDGTANGTVQIKDIYPGTSGGSPSQFAVFNGQLFFRATDGITGGELWTSDGTANGTFMVKEIRPGSAGSNPSGLVQMGQQLYFSASNDSFGTEMWTTDGTAAGTIRISDIASGASSSTPTSPFTPYRNKLYFGVNAGPNGREMYVTEGTLASTQLLKDINTAGSSVPTSLVVASGYLMFTANDGSNGSELWRSDGTSAGTQMVKDLRSGNSSTPSALTRVGDRIVFRATTATEGLEPFLSDGTAAGKQLLIDVYPGTSSSFPFSFTQSDTNLFFEADDGPTTGTEPWRGSVHFNAIAKSNPANQSACAGGSASFSISGTTYTGATQQWQDSTSGHTWANISGATGLTLNLSSLTLGMNGNKYLCRVISVGGEDTTMAALLTVDSSATITSHPANDISSPGYPASFSVAATGSGTLTYQWQDSTSGHTWANIGGATSSTYTTGTLSLADSGSLYRCVVSNTCGNNASNSAFLEVTTKTVSVSSGSWRQPGNWNTPMPGSGTDVTISGGKNIVLSGNGTCKNLTLGSYDTLTMTNGGNLIINGDLNLNGGKLICNGGKITFTKPGVCIPAATYHWLNLMSSSADTQYLCGDIVVNHTLVIGNTTVLNDNGFTASLKGILNLEGTHTGSGKLAFNAVGKNNTVSGNGLFVGNVESNGGGVSLNSPFWVNGTFTMTAGPVYIQPGVDLYIGNTSSSVGNLICNGGSINSASSGNGALVLLGNDSAPKINNLLAGVLGSLTIERPAGVSLGANTTVRNALQLNNGNLDQNGYNLNIGQVNNTGVVFTTTGKLTNTGTTGTLSIKANNHPSGSFYNIYFDTLVNFTFNSSIPLILGTDVYVKGLLSAVAGVINLNDHVMMLGVNASLSEEAGQGYVWGNTGEIKTIRNYTSAMSNVNVAGMDATFSTDIAPGLTTVRRGHAQYYNSGSGQSIARWYSFKPDTACIAACEFRYFDFELSGATASNLRMNKGTHTGSSWTTLTGGTRSSTSNPKGWVYQTNIAASTSGFMLTVSDSVNSPLSPVVNIPQEPLAAVQQKWSVQSYPNPFLSELVVKLNLPEATTAQVQLLALSGQAVYSQRKALAQGSSILSLPLSHLAQAMYILKISTADGQVITQPVVKETGL